MRDSSRISLTNELSLEARGLEPSLGDSRGAVAACVVKDVKPEVYVFLVLDRLDAVGEATHGIMACQEHVKRLHASSSSGFWAIARSCSHAMAQKPEELLA